MRHFFLTLCTSLLMTSVPAATSGLEISAPSALVMEASTGQVIYEKNADEQRSPASLTKIMTLILIFDAIDAGKIKMTDDVITSAYAKSMGGSQVFLEGGDIIGLKLENLAIGSRNFLIPLITVF